MNQSRGALTAQISRKRKEREDFFLPGFHKSNNHHHHVKGKQVQSLPPYPKTTSSVPKAPSEPVWSNRLLAGYMAHEFLTKGTLLGEQFDPARVQAVPLFSPAPGAEPKKKSAPAPASVRASNGEAAGSEPKTKKAYAEVATLLKTDGAHIPGIVNPSQLARWIQR